MTNDFPPNWGPQHSPEYVPIMIFLMSLCGLGFLSAVFPIINYIISAIVISILFGAVIWIGLHIREERKLDWEAQYGPLTEEEKEQVNDK